MLKILSTLKFQLLTNYKIPLIDHLNIPLSDVSDHPEIHLRGDRVEN